MRSRGGVEDEIVSLLCEAEALVDVVFETHSSLLLPNAG